ncbi:hypothetical protein SMJ63A_110108 [Stenotrophomonas geniculata]
MVAQQACVAGPEPMLPSRYNSDRWRAHAALNQVTQFVAERVKAVGPPLEPVTVLDLRRTI